MAEQRLARAVLAFMVAFATLLSAIVVAELHDHDCQSEGCSVCHVISSAQAMLQVGATLMAGKGASYGKRFIEVASAAVMELLLAARSPVWLADELDI